MIGDEIRERIRLGLKHSGMNQYSAALSAGLPEDAIRTVLRGNDPRATRLAEICDALGLEFYVGPPRSRDRSAPRDPDTENRSGFVASHARNFEPNLEKCIMERQHGAKAHGPREFDLGPVTDPELATVIATITDEFEGLNDHGRKSLFTRFWSYFPDLRARAESRTGRRLARMAGN